MSTSVAREKVSGKFLTDILWVGLSQVFTYLLGIGIFPVLTKTFSSEYYGVWVQVNATVGLLINIITLQFSTAVVRYLAGEDDKLKRRRYFGSMISTVLIVAIVTLLVVNLVASNISILIFNNTFYTNFARLTFLWASIDAIFTVLISYLRAVGQIKRLSLITASLATSKIILIVVLSLSGVTLQWIIAGIIGVELIFASVVIMLITRFDGCPILNFSGLKEYLSFCIPQLPVGVLSWFMSFSDNYFITHFLNLSKTGTYSTSNSLGAIIALFYFPIGYVLYPLISRSWEQNRKEDTKSYFEISTRIFITLSIPSAIGLAILSQPLLRILATPEYLTSTILVLLIAISQIFLGIFTINEYIVYLVKQTKWLPLIIVLSAGTSVGLNVLLIPRLGILGAAISKIAAYFILALIVTVWIRKTICYKIDLKYLAKVLCGALIMVLPIYYMKVDSILGIILYLVIGFVTFGMVLLILRAFSKQDIQMIKQLFGGFRNKSKVL